MNRVKNLRLILTILAVAFSLSSHAQISFGGLPSAIQTRALRSAEEIPSITITPDTTETVEANQFAFKTDVNIDIAKEASSVVDGENIVYRLIINSENAKSLNLIFTSLHLPDNAKVYLFRPDGGEIYGAYTNRSFSGDVFATTPVSGDSIMIQCEVPVSSADSFSATISAVNVGFDELRLLPNSGKASFCETDMVCMDEAVEDQSRSACLIIINGTRYCSGSLIASDDETASFVLTSAHCLRDNTNRFDSTLANKCVFYFGYSTSICEARFISSYEKSVSGSNVVSSNHGKDMALLKLSQRPPVDYMTFESGWNVESAPHGPVVCLHHPNGDLLKISISEDDPMPISFETDGLVGDSHWKIETWAVGVTEIGSSGSPLYDRNGLIIGALSGGNSLCTNKGDDKYWRLNNVWDDPSSMPNSIMSVLDPYRSGIIRMEGKETNDNRCYPLRNYHEFSEFDEPYKEGYGYASGKNEFGLEEFAEKFTSPYDNTEIHGISFIPILGSYSTKNPVYLRIYSGDEKPETLIYESPVKVTAREYKSKASGFSTTTVSNWSYKENYIRLDSVVKTGKTFFVSFYTDYQKNDFAMLATVSSPRTAFFKKNGEWESWDNHPFDKSVGGLLINTVVREADTNSADEIPTNAAVTVYPNPTKDIININCTEEVKNVSIFGVDGAELLYSDDKKINVKDLPKGIYSAEITTDKGKYHTKFIKE